MKEIPGVAKTGVATFNICTAGKEYKGRPYIVKELNKAITVVIDDTGIRTRLDVVRRRYDDCKSSLRPDINLCLAQNGRPILTDEEYENIERDWCMAAERKGAIPMALKPKRNGTFPSERLEMLRDDDSKLDFISKCVSNNLAFFNIGLNPVLDDDQLCDRLNLFFDTCAKTNQIPNVEKLSNCLGFNRQWVVDVCDGQKNGFTTQTRFILKNALQILASIDAELATSGKTQPVVYMFRAKNYYGMSDNKKITVENKSPLEGGRTEEELEAKYQEYVDVDSEKV